MTPCNKAADARWGKRGFSVAVDDPYAAIFGEPGAQAYTRYLRVPRRCGHRRHRHRRDVGCLTNRSHRRLLVLAGIPVRVGSCAGASTKIKLRLRRTVLILQEFP